MTYLWVKAFHVFCFVSWMAGIFYLPRLFVYHAMCDDDDQRGKDRFVIMERKLYFGIMTPSAVLTLASGLMMIGINGMSFLTQNAWLHAKLTLVALLFAYHGYCFSLWKAFRDGRNQKSHKWFRVFNEVPVFMLIGISILVIVKPF